MEEADASTFSEKVLQAPGLILVDFWAPWCAPCRALAPTLERVARSYGDGLSVVKVNVDNASQLRSRYAGQGIPAMVLFKGGTDVGVLLGAVPEARIRAFIDSKIGASNGTPAVESQKKDDAEQAALDAVVRRRAPRRPPA